MCVVDVEYCRLGVVWANARLNGTFCLTREGFEVIQQRLPVFGKLSILTAVKKDFFFIAPLSNSFRCCFLSLAKKTHLYTFTELAETILYFLYRSAYIVKHICLYISCPRVMAHSVKKCGW